MTTQRTTLALLVLLVGMLGWVGVQQRRNQAPSISEIVEAVRSDKVNLSIDNTYETGGPMLVAKWTDVNGFQREVHTRKGEPGFEDETEEQFQDRHDARVAKQLERYPKA